MFDVKAFLTKEIENATSRETEAKRHAIYHMEAKHRGYREACEDILRRLIREEDIQLETAHVLRDPFYDWLTEQVHNLQKLEQYHNVDAVVVINQVELALLEVIKAYKAQPTFEYMRRKIINQKAQIDGLTHKVREWKSYALDMKEMLKKLRSL